MDAQPLERFCFAAGFQFESRRGRREYQTRLSHISNISDKNIKSLLQIEETYLFFIIKTNQHKDKC